MNLRQQLQLTRSLRNLRTWAPPIAIGVIVGVGFFTLADNLTPQPVALETARPALAPQQRAYAPPPQQSVARTVQPELPPYLRQASNGSRFGNCAAARAAGRSSIRYDEDGYAEHLDGDHDGIACEPYYGR